HRPLCNLHLACVCGLTVGGLGAVCVFFFQAEDGIRDRNVTGVQTCALPILRSVFQRTLKDICIYEKPSRWFIMISNCLDRSQKCFIPILLKSLRQPLLVSNVLFVMRLK